MVYILDAYNIIHAISEFEEKLDIHLRAARDHLISVCVDLFQSRGDIRKIIIVFDGKSEFSDLPQEAHPGLEILFTETREDADDRIVDILGGMPELERVVVVSNDNYVLNSTRAHRSQRMSAQSFYDLMNKGPAVQKPRSGKKNISDQHQHDITKEYKQILGID